MSNEYSAPVTWTQNPLAQAVERSLSYLSSYIGGGAQHAYEQARAALDWAARQDAEVEKVAAETLREARAALALEKAAPALLAAAEQALAEIIELTDSIPEYDPDYLRKAIALARPQSPERPGAGLRAGAGADRGAEGRSHARAGQTSARNRAPRAPRRSK